MQLEVVEHACVQIPTKMRALVDEVRGKLRKSEDRLQTCMRGYLNVRVDDLVPDPRLVHRLKDDVLTARPSGGGGLPPSQRPKSYPVWKEGKTDEFMCLPRHLGLHLFGPPDKDLSVDGEPVSHLAFRGSLKPFQTKVTARVIDEIQDPSRGGAVLVASCGTGKTVMAINVICRVGVKTAIVVHKEFLLKQWAERLAQFAPDARVGVVQRDRAEAGAEYDVSLCMVHSLLSEDRYPRSMFEPFGLVVFDETHHISARTFRQAAGMFPARRRLGLTATPKRADGLGYLLTWLLGPVVCEARRKDGGRVEVRRVDNDRDKYPILKTRQGSLNFSGMGSRVVKDPPRTKMVARLTAEALKNPDRNIIVASDRVQHLRDMMKATQALRPDVSMGLYVGATTKKDRLTRAENGESCRVLFTSFRMGEEGLDIPRMNTLVLASPKKQVEQLVGRITRGSAKEGGVCPLVVDVVDIRNTMFEGMYKKRARTYRRLGFSFV